MKKIIIVVLMALVLCGVSNAQNVKRTGNTFTVESVSSSKSSANVKTKYTYKHSDSKEYPIMLSKNGRAYVELTSKNGNVYKKYLGEDISRTICKELGVEYKESSK